MAERFLDRGLNALAGIVTRGKFGVEVTPEFQELQEELISTDKNLFAKIYDSGTLIVIDDKNQRIYSRYRLVKRSPTRNTQRDNSDNLAVEIMSIEQRKNTGIPEDGILQVSNELTFDVFKSELRANSTGKTVYLTGKSLGLLLLLASTPDEVVTYNSIIDCIWDDRGVLSKILNDSDIERLQVAISHLRKKIDHLELYFNPIVLHRRRGYSFSPKPRNTD